MANVILLFHRDLRLRDHAALKNASDTGHSIIPLYIHDNTIPEENREGGASLWWLNHSLSELDRALRQRGSRLILRKGSRLTELERIVAETHAESVFISRRYAPWEERQDQEIAQRLSVPYRRFRGYLLFEPEDVKTKSGTPFRVFTPFFKACLALGSPFPADNTVPEIAAPSTWPVSEELRDWCLLPSKPDWSGGISSSWNPGEAGALERLDAFRSVVDRYDEDRDRPDREGTSRLSPHLHFGEISPRACWLEFSSESGLGGRNAFLRELIWREFSYHLLAQFPDMAQIPLQKKFLKFPWRVDHQNLTAWQRGRTGYPIIDAGMRQLWKTGWMHNRVRMIVASFLIKHLLIGWQNGQNWFWDTLVDADPANNAASWQWVAGCGADAAPFFRIFNPMTQGAKFDPNGNYVREWVPEISQLPAKFIHEPWLAPPQILARTNIRLGDSYPWPIVDHKLARQRALDTLNRIKGE